MKYIASRETRWSSGFREEDSIAYMYSVCIISLGKAQGEEVESGGESIQGLDNTICKGIWSGEGIEAASGRCI